MILLVVIGMATVIGVIIIAVIETRRPDTNQPIFPSNPQKNLRIRKRDNFLCCKFPLNLFPDSTLRLSMLLLTRHKFQNEHLPLSVYHYFQQICLGCVAKSCSNLKHRP